MIRNALLCTIATLTLAACGGGSSASSSAAATSSADSASALVSPNVGMIDRSQSSDSSESATSVASNTTATVTKVTTPIKTVDGVATLDWMPPTENNDGTILTNLAGYTVYYGTSPGDLSKSVKVTNPGLTAYSVTGLTSGTWYFAVTSYSADGIESTRTTIVSTKI
jgi:ABC-type Fe3+-hydroxamate transport system substrate-binding protein